MQTGKCSVFLPQEKAPISPSLNRSFECWYFIVYLSSALSAGWHSDRSLCACLLATVPGVRTPWCVSLRLVGVLAVTGPGFTLALASVSILASLTGVLCGFYINVITVTVCGGWTENELGASCLFTSPR